MAEPTEFSSCGVCGRTILRGEKVTDYADPGGSVAGVCALCKPAAEAGGWLPADLVAAAGPPQGGRRRGLSLRRRIARVSTAARGIGARSPEPEADSPAAPAEPPAQAARPSGERRSRPTPRRRPARTEESQDGRPAKGAVAPSPAPSRRSPSATPRSSPKGAIEAAIARFNASRERRKVAGLIRSLGEPRVVVRAGSAGAVLVTVAWELSWYRWEVGSEAEGGEVAEAGKGNEISELDRADRTWNARAARDGTVSLDPAPAPGAGANAGE